MDINKTQANITTGPHYPLGTLPRAYDILGPTKKWKGENKNKYMTK
jgi:hypothetical protein